MQCFQPKYTRRKLHRKVFKRIKESKWGISHLVNQTSLKHKTIGIRHYYDISGTDVVNWPGLLSVYTNNVTIKITRHRIIGDGSIWEGISLVNVSRVSQ